MDVRSIAVRIPIASTREDIYDRCGKCQACHEASSNGRFACCVARAATVALGDEIDLQIALLRFGTQIIVPHKSVEIEGSGGPDIALHRGRFLQPGKTIDRRQQGARTPGLSLKVHCPPAGPHPKTKLHWPLRHEKKRPNLAPCSLQRSLSMRLLVLRPALVPHLLSSRPTGPERRLID